MSVRRVVFVGLFLVVLEAAFSLGYLYTREKAVCKTEVVSQSKNFTITVKDKTQWDRFIRDMGGKCQTRRFLVYDFHQRAPSTPKTTLKITFLFTDEPQPNQIRSDIKGVFYTYDINYDAKKQASVISLQIAKDQTADNTTITASAMVYTAFYIFKGKSDDGSDASFTKYIKLENLGLGYEKKH